MFKLSCLFSHKRCILQNSHLWFRATISTVPLGANTGLHSLCFLFTVSTSRATAEHVKQNLYKWQRVVLLATQCSLFLCSAKYVTATLKRGPVLNLQSQWEFIFVFQVGLWSKPQVLLELALGSVITPLPTNKNDKVTVPVSIFFQLHLLSVPIGSKDSHENIGVSTTTFNVSSHNRHFVEDLVRIWKDQVVSFKLMSVTHSQALAKG